MTFNDGDPIDVQDAWNILSRWKNRQQEIGVIFWGRSGNLNTLGHVEEASKGRIQLRGEGARASFTLTGASFRYGPMPTWPRWPSPPIVEVRALRAVFDNGDYLALAEGLTAPPVPPVSLTA